MMNLTWKDLLTTTLAAATVGMYYAVSHGFELPIVSGYRGGILVLTMLGIGMCAFSSANTAQPGSIFITIASVLGAAALVFIIYGLITGAKAAFVLLAMTTLVLWLLATVRHALF